MRKLYFLLLMVGLVVISACRTQRYTASNFVAATDNHELVAIMPVQMVFTGRQPKKLTEEDIRAIEEAESEAFQVSLYNAILSKAGKMPIQFQSLNETNRLLAEKGISIRESWTYDDTELAKMLGVDALVRMRVEKQRYMSDLAAFGVDVAQELLFVLSQGGLWPVLPRQYNNTEEIRAKTSLINGEDAQVLWNIAIQRAADWDRPDEFIINNITRKSARNFPY